MMDYWVSDDNVSLRLLGIHGCFLFMMDFDEPFLFITLSLISFFFSYLIRISSFYYVVLLCFTLGHTNKCS